MVGDEGQQFLVARREKPFRGVALHRDHAERPIVARQRHAEPAFRRRSRRLNLAGGLQRGDRVAIDQQRTPGAQHVLRASARHPAPGPALIVLIDRVRELQLVAALTDDGGDEEVPRVDQFADDGVHGGVELLGGARGAGQLGDAVQRSLQSLAPTALGDLPGQALVGAREIGGALLYPPLQILVRLLAFQGGKDVGGDEGQQDLVVVGVPDVGVITLHHDTAANLAAAQHRHAEPVGALGSHVVAAVHAQLRPQCGRRTMQRAAAAQHREGEAVGEPRRRHLRIAVDRRRVEGVDHVEEADDRPFRAVADDEAVFGVHQAGYDAVQAAQHLRHLEVGAGHVRDRVQRMLKALGAAEAIHRAAQALDTQLQLQRRSRSPLLGDAFDRHRAGRGGIPGGDQEAVFAGRDQQHPAPKAPIPRGFLGLGLPMLDEPTNQQRIERVGRSIESAPPYGGPGVAAHGPHQPHRVETGVRERGSGRAHHPLQAALTPNRPRAGSRRHRRSDRGADVRGGHRRPGCNPGTSLSSHNSLTARGRPRRRLRHA